MLYVDDFLVCITFDDDDSKLAELSCKARRFEQDGSEQSVFWKVLDFFLWNIPGPGKSWKNILESHAF